MGATTSPGLANLPLQVWDSYFGRRHPALDSERHLDATLRWLANAQDAGDDDGVARMFHLQRGWGASYPETTGYIIPTCLVYARHFDAPEFHDRAIRMARWESAVQMESGAVQGGMIGAKPSPAIFNTGQVLFGWCAAYSATGDAAFRASALGAADYLVAEMDADGAWRRNLSEFTTAPIDTYAYNVRNAWALLIAQELDPEKPYRSAALKNIDFVLTLAAENGWLDKNCLARPEQPLLHTIAYAYQGLLECAVLESRDDVLDCVVRGNRELAANLAHFGSLHGRYDSEWRPTVKWRCLTGEAQTAIVWQRLAAVTGELHWRDAAATLIRQLKQTQKLDGKPGTAGGVKGSWPVTAPYGRLQYLNWAAKFFADALMLDLGVGEASVSG